MSTSPDPLCPFCGHSCSPGQELSKDHVFGRAFGARTLVTAHKSCNNDSGRGPEGQLHRKNSLFILLKAQHGLDAAPIPATFASGRSGEFVPASGKLWMQPGPLAPPAGGAAVVSGPTFSFAGTPAQAKRAYAAWRSRNPGAPAFENLPAGAVRHMSVDQLTSTLVYSEPAAPAVALKSALGACTLAYGPAFPATAFSSALRTLAAAPPRSQPRVEADYLGELDRRMALAARTVGPRPISRRADARPRPADARLRRDLRAAPRRDPAVRAPPVVSRLRPAHPRPTAPSRPRSRRRRTAAAARRHTWAPADRRLQPNC